MKVEGEIWTVHNGQIKEIKVGTQIFVPKGEAEKNRRISSGLKYSKTYNTWITEREFVAVKRAIQKVAYGYKPTSKAIAEETQIPLRRVQATLEILREEGVVRRIPDGYGYIYRIVGGEEYERNTKNGAGVDHKK